MKPLFRTYIRTFKGEPLPDTKAAHSSQEEARAAFEALINRTDLDSQKLLAVLFHQNSLLADHRFDRSPGDSHYWRGRLDEIPWPVQLGRPVELEGGGRQNVYLDGPSIETAKALGEGNVSAGVRKALAMAREALEARA